MQIADLIKTFKYQKNKIIRSRRLNGESGCYRFSHGIHSADRISITNHLMELRGYTSYLEIGVRRKSAMHNAVSAKEKVSVDPDPNAGADHQITSDEYFSQCKQTFDLIFIDGLHTGEQVERDIRNSLNHLNENGAILLHDMNPPTAFHARETYEVDGKYPAWNGTSWKGYAWHRKNSRNLRMFVVDTDWGVGWIEKGAQELWSGPIDKYEDLERHRRKILNLISVEEFIAISNDA
jgi:hypothetical protein